MKGYFVTGTDTNVGKTYVSCALARRAHSLGRKVFAFKPIETGCELRDGRRVGADQELLVAAAGGWQQGPLRGLYQLPLPLAPLVAAEAAGTAFDLPLIIQTAQSGAADSAADLTIVEGAGGWRVPITRSVDMAGLAKDLGLPVLVVARAGLGTINHTLLTIEAVERDSQSIAAVVMSRRPDDDQEAAERNRAEIRRRWPGSILLLASDPAVLDDLV